MFVRHTLYYNTLKFKSTNRPESNMLEILPKMLLGICQNFLLLCSISVLLCLHYAPKLVRFVTIFNALLEYFTIK